MSALQLERSALEQLPAAELSTDQLAHLLACRRAVEAAGPPPPLDWESRERTVEERLYSTAEGFRSWGAPERDIGLDLAQKLLRLGYSSESAEQLLRSVGVEWTAPTEGPP
jgi:hypothetical protein